MSESDDAGPGERNAMSGDRLSITRSLSLDDIGRLPDYLCAVDASAGQAAVDKILLHGDGFAWLQL